MVFNLWKRALLRLHSYSAIYLQVTFFLAFLALEARREEKVFNSTLPERNEDMKGTLGGSFTIQTNPLHDDSAKDLTYSSNKTQSPWDGVQSRAQQLSDKNDNSSTSVDPKKKKLVGRGLFDEIKPSITAR